MLTDERGCEHKQADRTGVNQVCGGGFEVGVTDLGENPLPHSAHLPESPGRDESCVLRVRYFQRLRHIAQSKMSLALKNRKASCCSRTPRTNRWL